ncbi:Mitochondrial import inner membrane translocase subunit PAM16 like 2 [Bienertia sinuspersici]
MMAGIKNNSPIACNGFRGFNSSGFSGLSSSSCQWIGSSANTTSANIWSASLGLANEKGSSSRQWRYASKTGAAQEAMQGTVRRASKTITEQEARQILGVPENAAWEEILNKYNILFESNAKQGSFYLQSKVHRAKEYLEGVYRNKGQGNTI